MITGWIAQDGTLYFALHTEHWKVAETMKRSDFPAIRLCQNGYAFFDAPVEEISQAQLDALFDWTQEEPNAESWEVIAEFLGIEQERT